MYQVNTVSRIAGEGRAEFLKTWGADFNQKGGGRGGGGAGDGWGFVRDIILLLYKKATIFMVRTPLILDEIGSEIHHGARVIRYTIYDIRYIYYIR